jgi:hypothetical protein
MSEHRYPRAAAIADYARAGTGLAIAGAPFLLTTPAPAVATVLVALLALFAVNAVRSVVRHRTQLHLDANGVDVHGWFGGSLPWRDVQGVSLAYYSTRRDHGAGWLLLTMTTGRRRVAVDLRMQGFDRIAAAAMGAARRNGLAIDAVTHHNLQAFGIAGPAWTPPEGGR